MSLGQAMAGDAIGPPDWMVTVLILGAGAGIGSRLMGTPGLVLGAAAGWLILNHPSLAQQGLPPPPDSTGVHV